MATPEQIIQRLYADFDCQLPQERVLELMSSLEAQLARGVLRRIRELRLTVHAGEDRFELPFEAEALQRVQLDGRELSAGDLSFRDEYLADKTTLVLAPGHSAGILRLSYIELPEKLTSENFHKRQLLLPDGFEEIYLYHILLRAALATDDIERLNNYSALYTKALSELGGSQFKDRLCSRNYRNIW